MSYIHARQRWKRQPHGRQIVDSGNALSRGLVFVSLPGVGDSRNLVDGVSVPTTNTVVRGAASQGRVSSGDGVGFLLYSNNFGIDTSAKFSAYVYSRNASVSGTECGLIEVDNPFAAGFRWHSYNASAGAVLRSNILPDNGTGGSDEQIFATGGSEWHSIGLALDSGVTGGTQLYADGLPGGSAFTTTLANSASSVVGIASNRNVQLNASGHYMEFAALWNRILTRAEWLALHENRYQLLRPLQRRIYVNTAAGGGGGFKPFWAVQNNSVVGVGVH
jgi:hypothetical protein